MSGPKVVRIVTRAELIERCESQLAQLDGVIQHWVAVGKRNGTVSETDIDQVERVQRRLRGLLEAGQFKKVEVAVPQEIAFLRSDKDRRLQEAAEATASEQSRHRRLQTTAGSLLLSLQSNANVPEASIVEALESVRSGSTSDLGEAQQVISQAVSALTTSSGSEPLSDAQKELAAQLGADLEGTSFEAWLAQHGTVLDKQLRRIDGFIAEIDLREGSTAARPLSERAAAIVAEASADRRQLLADSLVMDLASRAREVRAQDTILDEMMAVRGELLRIAGGPSADLAAALTRALEMRDLSQARELVDASHATIEEHRQRRSAQSRREVVLGALQELGYELREGMETVTPSGGRLVLRSSQSPEYGVEVSGAAIGERTQLRPVAFRTTSDSASAEADLKFESRWCGQFYELRNLIGRLGGNCEIEQATPVGSVPLKVMEEENERGRRAEIVQRSKSRTMK